MFRIEMKDSSLTNKVYFSILPYVSTLGICQIRRQARSETFTPNTELTNVSQLMILLPSILSLLFYQMFSQWSSLTTLNRISANNCEFNTLHSASYAAAKQRIPLLSPPLTFRHVYSVDYRLHSKVLLES